MMNRTLFALQEVGRAKARVEAKIAEEKMLRDLATSATAAVKTVKIGGEVHAVEKVSGSPTIQDRMAETVAEIADKSSEIEQAMKDLDKAIERAEDMIFGLPPRYYRVLHKHFVEGYSIQEIADEMCLSYSTVATDKSKALAETRRKVEGIA